MEIKMNFVSKEQLEHWALEASEKYLGHQIPLNDTIGKIASDNSLNPEQIKRICEFANINTNLSLFSKTADKRFSFEQADASQIMRGLNCEDRLDKVANIWLRGSSGKIDPDISIKKNSKDNTDFDKLASEKTAEIDKLALLNNLDLHRKAIEELKMRKLAAESLARDAENKLHEEMKSRVVGGMDKFSHFCACALDHGKDNVAKAMIKESLLKVGYQIAKEDRRLSKSDMKKLAAAVPDEYISEVLDAPGTPYIVRNGNLNMYYVLDTLVTQRERAADYDKPLLLLNDEVKYIKKQLTS